MQSLRRNSLSRLVLRGASSWKSQSSAASVHSSASSARDDAIRMDWTREEVKEIYETPFLELIHRAAGVHREHNDPSMVQYVGVSDVAVDRVVCLQDHVIRT
jgi:hypothetical protein